jgi:hypothetical protein
MSITLRQGESHYVWQKDTQYSAGPPHRGGMTRWNPWEELAKTKSVKVAVNAA